MFEKHELRRDAKYINRLNRIEVLRLIRESDEISRAGIVKKTKLSAPTVTRIVDSLINDNLVSVVGQGDSTGGRPPKIITFKGDSNFVIGVDLGSTSIRAGISNLNGDFLTEIETPTDRAGGVERVISQCSDLINRLIERSKLDNNCILGLGIAVAGLINVKDGSVEYSPMFNWRNVDLLSEFRKYIDLPIFFDNVSRVTALGELLYGIGKEHKNFVSINVGYGIGAGIIINGVRYFGHQGFTGELGHIVVDSHSKFVGDDGIRGSLEALSSGSGIAAIAKSEVADKGNGGAILEKAGGDIQKITAKNVFDAALEGDELATQIIDDAMHFLAVGLDSVIKLFNPSAIVLSGGLTRNGDIFFEKLTDNLQTIGLIPSKERLALHASSFKEDATLMGAFSLVISEILELGDNVVPAAQSEPIS